MKFNLLSIKIGRHSSVPFGHSKILPNMRPLCTVSLLLDGPTEGSCRVNNARGAPT